MRSSLFLSCSHALPPARDHAHASLETEEEDDGGSGSDGLGICSQASLEGGSGRGGHDTTVVAEDTAAEWDGSRGWLGRAGGRGCLKILNDMRRVTTCNCVP